VRVLHICQPTDGGAAVVVAQLARAGVAAGDTVTVACPGGAYLADWVAQAGARWVELSLQRSPTWRDLPMCARIRPMLVQADIVHLHSSKAGAVGRIAAMTTQSARPRIIFTPHGWSWYVQARGAGLCRRFERLAARVTDVITVVSSEELRAGRAVLGAGCRIDLIENGVDTHAFDPHGPRAERRSAPLLVQVGRLSTQKAQDRSIRALAACADRGVRLRLVGDGPERGALERLARQLGVDDRLEFTGSDDPRPHLRAADIVLLPSRWEGMSLVLLEAMSIGAAVVSADCAGSDVLDGCGMLVDHADDTAAVAGIARSVTEMLADPELRRDLGDRARRRIEQHHALADVLVRYHALWRSLSDVSLA
jgi:glycosyltransferase involved in cell wall biosynthesis